MIRGKPESEKDTFLVNKYAIILTLLLLITLAFLWFRSSKNYQAKLNDLYANGQAVAGEITDVIDNNLNEGNIRSWDIYYYYFDNDSVRRTGKIHESNESKKKKISVGGIVYVIYSKADPEFHVASLSMTAYEPIGLLSAMLGADNIFGLPPVLLVGIVFLAQTLYLYKTRNANR